MSTSSLFSSPLVLMGLLGLLSRLAPRAPRNDSVVQKLTGLNVAELL